MLSRTYTIAMTGLKPTVIEVEIDAVQGKPGLIVIGLASKAVDEARERITSALLNCGIRIRSRKTVVNLAPADFKKNSSAFELAIVMGMLKLYEEVKIDLDLSKIVFFGELSLDGRVNGVNGALSRVLAARDLGFERAFVPQDNLGEVQVVKGISIYPVEHLQDLIAWVKGKQKISCFDGGVISFDNDQDFLRKSESDFAQIYGQKVAKRALEIAAAGGHNVLLIGTPGSGKSLLAKSLPSILPPLSEEESLEVSQIYSVGGLVQGLIRERAFRSPHHTISRAGLIGGGANPIPGEISLAHKGILFLDEFLEFPRFVIESLRQPLENGEVSISRASGNVFYPAEFSLIAATNLCPCGYFGSNQKECVCSDHSIDRYRKKLSGPIWDRIDMAVIVKEVEPVELTIGVQRGNYGESSQIIRQRVIKARELQAKRYKEKSKVEVNAKLDSKGIKKFIKLERDVILFLQKCVKKFNLSARSYFKVIQVSRTIADLVGAENISVEHVAEALEYKREIV